MEEELSKTFKIYTEEERLIRLDVLNAGKLDSKKITKRAELIVAAINKVLDENQGNKYHILVNILEEIDTKLTKEAEELYASVSENVRIVNIAVVGNVSTHSRTVNFLLPLTKLFPGKIAWFPNKEEAMIWLNAHEWDI